ncbi:MAG: zinc-binding dehydrogenase, partial [Bacteroidota bacterium]
KRRGATVYGTCSPSKMDYVREQGVDVTINYREVDFYKKIKEIRGDKGLDVVFDSLGGKEFAKGAKLLARGGKIVGFGNASRTDSWSNIFGDLGTLFGFGFWSAAFLLVESRGILGVNMLRIADHKPQILKHCLEQVVQHAEAGEFKPVVGKTFGPGQLAEAHAFMEQRKSVGKIVVEW